MFSLSAQLRFGHLLIESGLIRSAERLRVFIPLKTTSPTRASTFLKRNCGIDRKRRVLVRVRSQMA